MGKAKVLVGKEVLFSTALVVEVLFPNESTSSLPRGSFIVVVGDTVDDIVRSGCDVSAGRPDRA